MGSPAPSAHTAPSNLNAELIPVKGEQSLKRGRAESVEPSAPDQATIQSIASKKNRVASGAGPGASDTTTLPTIEDDTAAAAATQGKAVKRDSEGNNVGDVRRKVAQMSYVEEAEAPKDDGEDEETEENNGSDIEAPRGNKDESTGPEEKSPTSPESVDGGENKRASLEKTTKTSAETEQAKADPLKPKKTQPTFGSFASSSSPFASLSANPVATAPGDASKRNIEGSAEAKESEDSVESGEKKRKSEGTENSSTAETEAKRVKDNAEVGYTPLFGSVQPTLQAANKTATAPAKAGLPNKTPATFGSFASSASAFAARSAGSPFAAAGTSAAGSSGASASPSPAAGATGSSTPAGPASSTPFSGNAFGNYSSSFSAFANKTRAIPDAKKDSEVSPVVYGSDFDKEAEDENKNKVQMTEQDVHTGEEEEATVHQVRSKLYVMESDGGWRERGVGTLKLNVRQSDGKAPRLVMRAEGVLRLILNVSLYVGMSCLEDGKHVRLTVFESGEKRFVTLRTGSSKAAAELAAIITDHIPVESKSTVPRASTSPGPSGPASSITPTAVPTATAPEPDKTPAGALPEADKETAGQADNEST